MTQKQKVLNHLKQGKITSMEAFEKYKITRLSSVINILRKEGFEIISHKPEKGNYSIYELLGQKQKPVARPQKSELVVEQTDLGIQVKLKDYEWPD